MSTTISVKDVHKTLGKREILKGVTFDVEEGDIFGFLGPNGAGKTTTIRTMMGLYKPDGGSVEIMGQDVHSKEVRGNLGFAFDPDGLYERMSAAENLAFYLKIYNKPVDRKKILEVLDLLGLKERADDKAGTFSKGMRQRLTIARALVPDPQILILDEPTSGVDPMEQIKIRNLLIEIADRYKKTIFLSTHNMDEVQRICNRIAILNKGCIQLTGNLNELRQKNGEGSITYTLSSPVSEALKEKLKGDNSFRLISCEGNLLKFDSSADIGRLAEIIMAERNDIVSVRKNDAGIEELYKSIVLSNEQAAK